MWYRRANVKGGTYFFTVNLAERNRSLLVDYVDVLRSVIKTVKSRHRFEIDAMVVLPDHLHTIWTLPEGDADFAKRWALIKAGFSRQLTIAERRPKSRVNKGERGIWQRRYWEHLIRDERDYNNHVDYIHYNPVKHGYVAKPVDWPYSSIHRYIRNRVIDDSWSYKMKEDEQEYGEPDMVSIG
ncbi:transposase [Pseudomonadota bacterium]